MPILTIAIPTKLHINANCVLSLLESLPKITGYKNSIQILPGKSNIDQSRSILLTQWFDIAKDDDLFLFIDSDQTFIASDIQSLIELESDVTCGIYSNSAGAPACHAVNRKEFYEGKSHDLYYGATGFMMIHKGICHRIYDYLKKEYGGDARFWISNNYRNIIPFFTQRMIESELDPGSQREWLGEDYSFCWLVRKVGGNLKGKISKTIGHEVANIKYFYPESYQSKTWPTNSIVYYTGNSRKCWSPNELSKGLGGSETAVIYLSQCWKKHGYDVTVYGNVDEGKYNGIKYFRHNKININDQFNVIVLWRGFGLSILPNIKAKYLLLDMHDLPSPQYQVVDQFYDKINKIMVKSEFHKSKFPKSVKSKIDVIPNGIIPALITSKLNFNQKNTYKLIYASSYDRGLEQMLEWGWPVIQKEVPNAELHVFYGMELVQDPQFVNKINKLIAQPGIYDHGKVGQKELNEFRKQCMIHYYVGDFEEIDCITVKESVLNGCIPIVSSQGVFQEQKYCNIIEGHALKKNTHLQAANLIIKILSKPKILKFYQEKLQKNIDQIVTWDQVGEQWLNMFSEYLGNNELKGIDNISVINLERRKDRLIQFCIESPINQKLVHRYQAVDGKTLEPIEEIKKLFSGNDFSNNKAVIGCAMSHYNLWKDFHQNSQNGNILILEDDVKFTQDFIHKWNNIYYPNLPEEYDLVYIGGRPDPTQTYLGEKINDYIGKPKYAGKNGKYGAFAYILSHQGIDKLLKYVEENGIKRAIDGILSDNYYQLKVYALDKFICYHDEVTQQATDIQNTHEFFTEL